MEYYHSPMLELLLSEFTRIEKLLSTLCKGKMFSEKNKEEESPYPCICSDKCEATHELYPDNTKI